MLGNSLRDQRSRYLELLVFLFELLVFVRVTVGELVDLDAVLLNLLSDLPATTPPHGGLVLGKRVHGDDNVIFL